MNQLCGCCEPVTSLTPLRVENRPGLSAILYRVGTYASFRESMLERIARTPELASLATRSSDDYAITFMELWAAIADILTFYQERYANEVFLRTATQRESVRRLAQLIDYHLRPGVAALARLVFNVEEGKIADIATGLKVQSLPQQKQLPQTFETLENLTADARLNRLRIYPAPAQAQALSIGRAESVLDRGKGPAITASISAGNRIVLFNDNATDPIEEKEIDSLRTQEDRIILTWKSPVQKTTWSSNTSVFKTGRSFRLFGYNAPAQYMTPVASGTEPQRITWSLNTLTNYSYPINSEERSTNAGSRLCLDGRYEGLTVGKELLIEDTLGKKRRVTIKAIDQAQDTIGSLTDTVTRLTVEPALAALTGSGAGATTFSPFTRTANPVSFNFSFPSNASLFDLFASSKFEPDFFDRFKITVDPIPNSIIPLLPIFDDRRQVIIHELSGPRITFHDFTYPATISDTPVYLPGFKVLDEEGEGIEVGRTIERNEFRSGVILRPKQFEIGRKVILADADGQPLLASITATPVISPASAVAGQFCHLILPVSAEGPLSLKTLSAVLLGNVALASHGETVNNEIVGSGNASIKFQKLALKKKPLTYVPSARAGGAESSLQVLVNGVLWKEVPGLFGQPRTAQVYATRIADDGTANIYFGDGNTGALPSSGANNVTANYRFGAGLAGRVGANALTTLLQRLPGLKDVTNPLPAEGGADPETVDTARTKAPLTVRTFGRAVSLSDFEDLVTSSGEVAKAQATFVWDGLDRAVHLTVAAQGAGSFSPESLRRIGDALRSARDPNHRLLLANFVRVPILLRAKLHVNSSFVKADVLNAALKAVIEALSFDALRLGQPLHLSDMYQILQEVAGVTSVDVDQLMFKRPGGMSLIDFEGYLNRRGVTRQPDGKPNPVQGHLRIFAALSDPMKRGSALPAELAWIESPTQDITITATGGL